MLTALKPPAWDLVPRQNASRRHNCGPHYSFSIPGTGRQNAAAIVAADVFRRLHHAYLAGLARPRTLEFQSLKFFLPGHVFQDDDQM